MKNILAIAPHPDDIELGCAGTLSKFKNDGYNIDCIITVKPSAEINPNRNECIVRAELTNSMKLLGFNYSILSTPLSVTGRPQLQWNNDTITQLERLMTKSQYDLIITTDSGDYHQDHHNTFNIVNSVCRGITKELWTMEINPYSHRNPTFNPTIFINISNTFNLKLQAIKCYNSYMTDEIIHSVTGLAMYRSQLISNSTHAEAFNQIFKIQE